MSGPKLAKWTEVEWIERKWTEMDQIGPNNLNRTKVNQID